MLERIRSGFPQIPRRVSGYNLDQLLPENGFHVARALVGSEGTCAIVLGATLRLIDSPQHRTLVGLGYPDAFAAADHVPAILESSPIGLEGFEGGIIDGLKHKAAPNLELLPAGRGILLVEYGSNDPAESRASAATARREAVASPRCAADADLQRGRSQSRLEDQRVRAARWRPPFPGRFHAGRAGTMRRSRPRSWDRTCGSCARCSTNTTIRRRSTGTSATAAFTCR